MLTQPPTQSGIRYPPTLLLIKRKGKNNNKIDWQINIYGKSHDTAHKHQFNFLVIFLDIKAEKRRKSEEVDPMDPSSYSDAPRYLLTYVPT